MTEKNVLLTLRAISFLVFAGFFVFHVFSDKTKSALLLEGCYLGSVDKKDTRIKNKNFGLA